MIKNVILLISILATTILATPLYSQTKDSAKSVVSPRQIKSKFLNIARLFIIGQLGMTPDELEKYKVKVRLTQEQKNTTLLVLEYFDPEVYPEWMKLQDIYGKYPGYFKVMIDPAKGSVIKYYASSD